MSILIIEGQANDVAVEIRYTCLTSRRDVLFSCRGRVGSEVPDKRPHAALS